VPQISLIDSVVLCLCVICCSDYKYKSTMCGTVRTGSRLCDHRVLFSHRTVQHSQDWAHSPLLLTGPQNNPLRHSLLTGEVTNSMVISAAEMDGVIHSFIEYLHACVCIRITDTARALLPM